MPRRDQILEVTRIMFDKDVQSRDIVYGFMKFVCATCITAARPYILVSTELDMVDTYAELGWEQVNSTSEEALLLGNAIDALSGKGINPIYWNYVWRDVSDYLLESGAFSITGSSRMMLRFYRSFGPLSRMYMAVRRRFLLPT